MEPDASSQPLPPTTQQPPVQPPAPEKRTSLILLWLLIVLLTGIATYFGYQNLQLRQQVVHVQQIPTENPTPSISNNPPINWTSYTNPSYSYFTFKHPPSSLDEPQHTTGAKVSVVFHQLSNNPNSEMWLYFGDHFTFTHEKNDFGTPIQLGGIMAIRRDIPAGQNPAQTLVEIQHDKDFITIQLVKGDQDQEIAKIFDQILSTFTFSNTPDTQTLNWKTYTNENAAFSLKLPPNLSELTSSETVVSGPLEANPQFITSFADLSTLTHNTDNPFDGFSIYEQDVTTLKANPFSFDQYLNEELKYVKQSPRGDQAAQVITQTSGTVSYSYIDAEIHIRRYFILSRDKTKILIIATATRSPQFLELMSQILATLDHN